MSQQPRGLEFGSANASWKLHPVYAFVAGLLTGATAAMQLLAPAQLGMLKYEVEDARRLVESSKAQAGRAHEKMASQTTTIKELEQRIAEAKKAVQAAQLSGLFPYGGPYPTGLGTIVLGVTRQQIEQSVTAGNVEKSKRGYWSIKTGHSHFYSATYYFDGDTPDAGVVRILFQVNYDSPLRQSNLLITRLTENFGPPTTISEDDYKIWNLPSGIVVQATDSGSYSVTASGGDTVTGSLKRKDRKSK